MGKQIGLGRIGHYFDAGNGSCSTAIVVDTFGPADQESTAVNVNAWNHGTTAFSRTSVPVDPSPSTEATANSFHLAGPACPFGK